MFSDPASGIPANLAAPDRICTCPASEYRVMPRALFAVVSRRGIPAPPGLCPEPRCVDGPLRGPYSPSGSLRPARRWSPWTLRYEANGGLCWRSSRASLSGLQPHQTARRLCSCVASPLRSLLALRRYPGGKVYQLAPLPELNPSTPRARLAVPLTILPRSCVFSWLSGRYRTVGPLPPGRRSPSWRSSKQAAALP